MIELVKPEFQTCIRYTEKDFWPNIVLSEELNEFINFTIPRLSDMHSIYWVVGKRGSGKSQVLEIIAKKCMENYETWKVLPIVVSIEGLRSEEDPSSISKALCQMTAENLVYLEDNFYKGLEAVDISPKNVWGGKVISELTKFQEKIESDKFTNIFQLNRLLKQVSSGHISYVLLIDELDKINPMSYFNFLIHNQNLFSSLIEAKAKMFISMSPDVFKMIYEKEVEEANFFRSKEINPPEIKTYDDCRLLIDNRIKMRKSNWHSPFDQPSYSLILKNCQGIPRDILRISGNIIEKAYNLKLPNIPQEFVKKYFEKGESDKEFSKYISEIMRDVTLLSRKILELENRDYAQILNVFLLDINAARRGDFSTLQSLGFSMDKSKYILTRDEMETKELLEDRGYGLEVHYKLKEFFEIIKNKWKKDPIDVSEELTKIKIMPPKLIEGKHKPKIIEHEPIDKVIIEIIEKNPFSSSGFIKEQLSKYQSGKELENWLRIASVRLDYLVRSEDAIKIDSEPVLYTTTILNLSKEMAKKIGQSEILKKINQLFPFMKSDNESENQIFLDSMNKLVRETIETKLNLDIHNFNNQELSVNLKEKGYVKISKYFDMYLNAVDLNDLELTYASGIKILSEVFSYDKKSQDIKIEKNELFNKLTKNMKKLKKNELFIDVLNALSKEDLNHLLQNIYHDYIPFREISHLSEFFDLDEGYLLKCNCGLKMFSKTESNYHFNCPEINNKMNVIEKAMFLPNKKQIGLFVVSIINGILKSIINSDLIDYNLTFHYSETGNFVSFLNSNAKSIIIMDSYFEDDLFINNRVLQSAK